MVYLIGVWVCIYISCGLLNWHLINLEWANYNGNTGLKPWIHNPWFQKMVESGSHTS